MDELQENIAPDMGITAPEVPIVEEAPVEEVVETVTEEVTEAEEIVEEPTEEVAEEAKEAEEVTEPEPAIIFDANEDLPELLEKVAPVLDKYELPAEVQAVIDVLKTKAETMPNDLQPYSDYGDAEAIKTLLERQSYLDTAVEVQDGTYRPNTNKFVEELKDPVVKDWLFYDLAASPSTKYQGLSKLEENIADIFGKEGETTGEVLNKYERLVEHLRTNSMPDSDVPTFVPDHLKEAFYKLPKDERNEIAIWDADDPYDQSKITSKIQSLELIQQGIEGQKYREQQKIEAQKAQEQAFTNDVISAQVNFFQSFRNEIIQDLSKNVQFSTDPKLNTLLANQQVALLTEAFDPQGEWARQTLADSGINFDFAKAQQLVKDIERASVQLTAQKRAVDERGNPLNSVELNKAVKEFERVGRNWQSFAKDIIDQETRLVSTGTAEDVKKQAEKIKIAPKARAVPKGSGVQTGKATDKVPAYGTPEYDSWRAKQVDTMWEIAQKSQAYQ